MSINRKSIFILLWTFLIIVAYQTESYAIGKKEKKEHNLLKQLEEAHKKGWNDRYKLIKEISKEKENLSKDEKDSLINLYKTESRFQEGFIEKERKKGRNINAALDKFNSQYLKKGYARYFSDFSTLIVSFKDKRTVEPLLRGLYDYGGAIVPTHIISIGSQAVDQLLILSKSESRTIKEMAFFVLSVWVNAPLDCDDYLISQEMAIKNKQKLDEIKSVLLEGLNAKESGVRSRAIFGLQAFPEKDVIKRLEQVAKTDPDKEDVRREAKKMIETLKLKMNSNLIKN
jgi:hypothetical protein